MGVLAARQALCVDVAVSKDFKDLERDVKRDLAKDRPLETIKLKDADHHKVEKEVSLEHLLLVRPLLRGHAQIVIHKEHVQNALKKQVKGQTFPEVSRTLV